MSDHRNESNHNDQVIPVPPFADLSKESPSSLDATAAEVAGCLNIYSTWGKSEAAVQHALGVVFLMVGILVCILVLREFWSSISFDSWFIRMAFFGAMYAYVRNLVQSFHSNPKTISRKLARGFVNHPPRPGESPASTMRAFFGAARRCDAFLNIANGPFDPKRSLRIVGIDEPVIEFQKIAKGAFDPKRHPSPFIVLWPLLLRTAKNNLESMNAFAESWHAYFREICPVTDIESIFKAKDIIVEEVAVVGDWAVVMIMWERLDYRVLGRVDGKWYLADAKPYKDIPVCFDRVRLRQAHQRLSGNQNSVTKAFRAMSGRSSVSSLMEPDPNWSTDSVLNWMVGTWRGVSPASECILTMHVKPAGEIILDGHSLRVDVNTSDPYWRFVIRGEGSFGPIIPGALRVINEHAMLIRILSEEAGTDTEVLRELYRASSEEAGTILAQWGPRGNPHIFIREGMGS